MRGNYREFVANKLTHTPPSGIDRSEDMYALMAPEYRGVVTAVVRRADWLRGTEIEE